jgi:hypothetical protein
VLKRTLKATIRSPTAFGDTGCADALIVYDRQLNSLEEQTIEASARSHC